YQGNNFIGVIHIRRHYRSHKLCWVVGFIRDIDGTASSQLPGWRLLFNRIAARPAEDDLALFTKARDLLSAIDAANIPCLNGARCHAIGASKSLQASLLAECEVPVPWTHPVSALDWEETLAKVDSQRPLLIKPNAGGRGRGISSPEDVGPETFAPDGCAVLQERIESGDGRIHRVEMMGGEVLYEATAPLEAETFDYCLAGVDDAALTFTTEPLAEIVTYCRRAAKAASLDLGSIEYLIDEGGSPWFIDINPVSSFVPEVGTRLGHDPFEKISKLLRGLLER
ncbi:MAG: hypothetical protein AAF491_11870, partial [Verrucomicrobiota bacterium]